MTPLLPRSPLLRRIACSTLAPRLQGSSSCTVTAAARSTLVLLALVVISSLAALPASASIPELCANAPGGERGYCVVVARCPSVVRTVNASRPMSSDSLRLLHETRCGYHHRQSKICCSNPSPISSLTSRATNETAVTFPSSSNGTYQSPPRSNGTSQFPPRSNGTSLSPPRSNSTSQSPPCSNGTSMNAPCNTSQSVPSDTSVTEHPGMALLPVGGNCGTTYSDRNYLPPNVLQLSDVRPTVARLEYLTRGRSSFRCGGSLISSRYVLTAAHCVTALPPGTALSAVVLGEFDVTTDPDCERVSGFEWCVPAVKRVQAERTIPHPDFSAATRQHDIALIRLDREIDLSQEFELVAACLPLSSFQYPLPAGSNLVETAGWGTHANGTTAHSKRMYGLLREVALEQCRTLHRSNATLVLDSQHVCARGKTDKDAAIGDSGGPLMVVGQWSDESAPVMVQVGVESFTPESHQRPTVFTNVRKYITWILDNLES